MIKYTLKVDGMMCPMCESHVNDSIRRAVCAKKVSSSHKTGEVVIIADSVDEKKLTACIEEGGYKVLSITSAHYEKKGFFASLFKK